MTLNRRDIPEIHVDGFFRFTKWLPNKQDNILLNDDLSGWEKHFDQRGIKTIIKEQEVDGVKVQALYREGKEARRGK